MNYHPTTTPPPPDGLYTAGWAAAIARDVAHAKTAVTLSALSLLPPRGRQTGDLLTLCAALKAAHAGGVKIAFILPAPTRAHLATSRNAAAADWAREQGFLVHLAPLPGLLHAKTALLDAAICWVGSGNLTTAAASHNHEAWARITDPRAAATLAEFHHQLRKK